MVLQGKLGEQDLARTCPWNESGRDLRLESGARGAWRGGRNLGSERVAHVVASESPWFDSGS